MSIRRTAAAGSDRGETLIELVVAVAILGIAAVAIVGAMMMSIRSSVVHRNDASGDAYVRSFAEAIQTYVDANNIQPCTTAASTYKAVPVTDLPAGYSKAVAVQSWNGSSWGACTADGIQRLDLTVTTTGDLEHRADETLTVVLRQPCNSTTAAALASGGNPCA
jgi:prepilin-type N-terminal cleavage/methylation domain-containing protein